MDNLRLLRLRLKEDFVSFRKRFSGYSINGQLSGISPEIFLTDTPILTPS